jgi:hypothetical protein
MFRLYLSHLQALKGQIHYQSSKEHKDKCHVFHKQHTQKTTHKNTNPTRTNIKTPEYTKLLASHVI